MGRKSGRALFSRACLILLSVSVCGCDQPKSERSATASSDAADNPTYVSVQSVAGGPYEQVALEEATDPSVIDASGQQVTGNGYPCASVPHLWKLKFTKDVGMNILKVRCSDGTDYQVTILDHKAFVKPWTGTLVGS